MKIIKEIVEVNRGDWVGFNIITTEQKIELSIQNFQDCCEQQGYFLSEDNLDEFIGAELLDIRIVDDALKVYALLNSKSDTYVMFVNIETNKGTLQFTAYNEHNGYYAHKARVVSKQLN